MIIQQIKRDDLEVLVKSWHIAYGDLASYFYPFRYGWLFNNNPFNNNKLEYPIIVAYESENIVSWVCNLWFKIFIKECSIPAAATINAFTLPEFRNKGLASKIYAYNTTQFNTFFFTIGMADETRRIKKKLGWINGRPQYQLICRVGKFDGTFLFKSLEKYFYRHNQLLSARFLVFLKYFGIQRLLRLFAHLVFGKKKSFVIKNINLEFIQIEDFETIWDELWQEIKANYTFGCERTAEYMNWKYSLQPHLHYYKFIIQNRGKKVGALVFRSFEKDEMPQGLITEVLLLNEASFYYVDVINFACKKLSDLGCQYIYMATGLETERNLALKQGFHQLHINVPLLHIPEKTRHIIRVEEIFKKDSSWLMSMGDQDMDQLQLNMHPGMTSIILVAMKRTPGIKHVT